MPTPRQRKGFTLVELLTVIAIVGVLAAITIPTVGLVKGAARNTQCLSNLRQLYTVLSLDIAENRNTLPLAWDDASKTSWVGTTYAALRDEQKDGGTLQIFGCPAQLEKINRTGSPVRTYGMSLCPTRAGYSPTPNRRPSLSEFPFPARTVILADGCPDGSAYNVGFAHDKPPELIHGKRANFIYLDGHAASLDEASIPAYGRIPYVNFGTPEGFFWPGR